MQQGVWRWLVPLAVGMHGLGMLGGVYFVFTSQSWFSRFLSGAMAARILVGALWVVSGIALIAAAWLFYQGGDWRPYALVGAPLSLGGILLWAGAVPPGTYVGALLDVAIIVYAFATRARP